MVVSFTIEYRTDWGERVCITGSMAELGNNNPNQAIPLHTLDGIHWQAEIALQPEAETTLSYHYLIKREEKIVRTEWNSAPRNLCLAGELTQHYRVTDLWQNPPEQQHLYSAAFTESLLAHRQSDTATKSYKRGLQIKTQAALIESHCCLAICGNQKALGNWDPTKALLMSHTHLPEWAATIDASKLTFPLTYKFVLYNPRERRVEAWENGPDRQLENPGVRSNETVVRCDPSPQFNTPAWKGAGVALPLFSLRSEESFGIGDLGDLKQLIDWAVQTHQQVVQILPINDTTMTHTWRDSYPYNSISIYAFHPIYIDLKQLGQLKDKKEAARFKREQRVLNQLPAVDYEAVNRLKWAYFRLIFAQEGEEVLASEPFQAFYAANQEWLQPYAAFSYLRDRYQTANFREWPEQTAYQAEAIEKLCSPGSSSYPEIALYLYLQYNLHLQLLEASRHARAQGVVLKGDIPIGISRNSVEAWREPHYFNLDGQAGAPPDDFSANGQNWGFPTYNWEVMEQDNYSWWMKRFRKMAEYFDAYRIDHILGFFRIWEIPTHAVHGLLGQFAPALPLSREEIEAWGVPFREAFLKPTIQEELLTEIFGAHTDHVKQHCIEPTGEPGQYRMRPEWDTQRKVEAFFCGKTDADSLQIREGLYTLISNVLFLPDHRDATKYHPRIAAQHDFCYRTLHAEEQAAFNRLYDHYYYQRHNAFWQQQAMRRLPQLIQSTRMLVCGEDLGMIPACVAQVMNDLQILSLEIQRMPKNPREAFGRPKEYPYRSVCTISTHDMSTLRGWWEEDPQQTQRYYNNLLGHPGQAPATASPQQCEEVVRNHLESNSMLCILALQDWLSIDADWRASNPQEERINIPANPDHYWQYRMHLTLEQLLRADSLTEKIDRLINQAGRASRR